MSWNLSQVTLCTIICQTGLESLCLSPENQREHPQPYRTVGKLLGVSGKLTEKDKWKWPPVWTPVRGRKKTGGRVSRRSLRWGSESQSIIINSSKDQITLDRSRTLLLHQLCWSIYIRCTLTSLGVWVVSENKTAWKASSPGEKATVSTGVHFTQILATEETKRKTILWIKWPCGTPILSLFEI